MNKYCLITTELKFKMRVIYITVNEKEKYKKADMKKWMCTPVVMGQIVELVSGRWDDPFDTSPPLSSTLDSPLCYLQ